MPLGSNTTDIAMINLVMTDAEGAGGAWQDVVQLIPLGMANDPVSFAAKLRDGLPLVNNLRVLFNEHSFNDDGSMHPQMEAFLAAAVAQGFELTMCYGEGDAQNIGIGEGRWPELTNAQAFAALEENFSDVSRAWAAMLAWAEAHPDVTAGVYGWELMNESASYRHSIRNNGAGDGLTATDFVALYTAHANQLADMIDARAEGKILVGGWGYNGDFLTLANTMLGGQSALQTLRDGVGDDLVWSAHLYPGWMGTDKTTTPAELIERLEVVFAPIQGDDVLITEINADGQINNPAESPDYKDFYAASYEWFAANGIGLGWYPGVQTGASHLLYLETNGGLTYRHQHSLAHAMNAFSLGHAQPEHAANEAIGVKLSTVRLRNETFEVQAGEASFDAVTKAGFAFGYNGQDTLSGTDTSNDFLYGGAGNDVLSGKGADDFLFGQDGSDRLLGGAMIDNLFGGSGNDTLDGGSGKDFLVGGKGNDSYVVTSTGDHVVEHAAEGTDRVETTLASYTLGAHLENLTYTGSVKFVGTGNSLANKIYGGSEVDRLVGGSGNDSLIGGAGNDTLMGGRGADLLDGGAGADTASYLGATSGVRADLTKVLTVSAGDAAGDLFKGIQNFEGSSYSDRLSGDGGKNMLWGGAGNDILSGRAGNDRLYGGTGEDQFIFRKGYDADRVSDFKNNVDTLVFDGFSGVDSASDALALARQSGAHVLFDFGSGDTLLVLNTTKAALANDISIL